MRFYGELSHDRGKLTGERVIGGESNVLDPDKFRDPETKTIDPDIRTRLQTQTLEPCIRPRY